MDFANILQGTKTEKSVKTLTLRVVLDSLRTVCHVFETFFIFQANKLRSSNFGMMDGMYVDNCTIYVRKR